MCNKTTFIKLDGHNTHEGLDRSNSTPLELPQYCQCIRSPLTSEKGTTRLRLNLLHFSLTYATHQTQGEVATLSADVIPRVPQPETTAAIT